jgi:hypothetical protein
MSPVNVTDLTTSVFASPAEITNSCALARLMALLLIATQ